MDWKAIEQEALDHLRALIRIDTTNPPGNETAAVSYLAAVLEREGLEPEIVESAPGRANLVVRLDGGDRQNALMISAHLDVVPAEAGYWHHPPFEAEIHDGYVWGRGAVDMKHMAVYGLMAVLLARRTGLSLRRDLVFVGCADEEAGMRHGSRYLVEKRPDLIEGKYCLTEIGGFTFHLAGQRIYPVQVAEKGVAWLRMTVRGTPGHGSLPHPDNAVVKLARAVGRLAARPLPRHPNVAVNGLIKGLAGAVGLPLAIPLRLLLVPGLGDAVLGIFPEAQRKAFGALLHDTACPTSLLAGSKENVIPSEASVVLDCRVLPGSSLEILLGEIRERVGEDAEFEVIHYSEPAVNPAGTALFDLVEQVLRERDPGCHVVRSCIPGYTDGAMYQKLGYVTYGFAPVKLPPGVVYWDLYHGHDERIPVDGFFWGLRTFYEVVRRFCA